MILFTTAEAFRAWIQTHGSLIRQCTSWDGQPISYYAMRMPLCFFGWSSVNDTFFVSEGIPEQIHTTLLKIDYHRVKHCGHSYATAIGYALPKVREQFLYETRKVLEEFLSLLSTHWDMGKHPAEAHDILLALQTLSIDLAA